MVTGLTTRQAEILALIRRSVQQTGMPPTRQEIAAELGFRSANAAEEHLRALARKGMIELLPGSSRGIRIAGDAASAAQGLPIIGRVAAGQPLLALEHIEDHCAVAPEMFKPRADYLLRVAGMSMRDAGILDGDLLAVHTARTARNGQLVVARIDDEVTVKRYRQHGNRITLLPENPDFSPIEIEPGARDFVIEGLGVGVLRTHCQ